MDEQLLAAEFERQRPRLFAVAMRALGSRADADDAVQETWLRLTRYSGEPIENLAGWLTRVVGRICIDMLRSRTARAESMLDPWADGDPIVADDVEGTDDVVARADTVGLAMMVVLESLKAEERLAFVLHDMFAVPFAEIGPIVGKSPDAAKMLASRARRKVQDRPLPTGEKRQRREVVDAFLAASREGDFDALMKLLDPEVIWVRRTAHGSKVVIGPNEVLAAVQRGDVARVEARRVSVDGEPGILAWGPTGRPIALMSCTVADGKIVAVESLVDPGRLARMDLPGRRG